MFSEFFYLMAIILMLFAIFGMTGLKMWYNMQQDTNLGRKVNGLSIDMGKVKKALREGYTTAMPQTAGSFEVPGDVLNMSLEDAAEAIGFDKKDLNNPIVRPIAQKIFDGIKAKAAAEQQGNDGTPEISFI